MEHGLYKQQSEMKLEKKRSQTNSDRVSNESVSSNRSEQWLKTNKQILQKQGIDMNKPNMLIERLQ